jgi:hypothetical protein
VAQFVDKDQDAQDNDKSDNGNQDEHILSTQQQLPKHQIHYTHAGLSCQT